MDDPRLTERIYHMPWTASHLRWDQQLEESLEVLPRVKAAGFTAVALVNSNELAFPSRAWPGYGERLKKLADAAHGLGLDVVVMVTNLGNGQAIINQDPTLAEPIPVKDALFVVEDNVAELQADPPVVIQNPGFEGMLNGHVLGWDDPDGASPQAVMVDEAVYHGGERSVRFDLSMIDHPLGFARLSQEIALTPFRLYRATVWIRTENTRGRGAGSLQLWTGERQLHYWAESVEQTQDWTRYSIVFNSLDHGSVRLRVDASSRAGRGYVWFDDVVIEEIGMLNIVRREGCPLTVRGQDGTVYVEGIDFEPVHDPMLWALHPWGGWSLSHEPPVLKLTNDSRLIDGDRLRVSFYAVVPVYAQQASACLSHPRCYELLKAGLEEIHGLTAADGYHLSLGEHRTANWCELCRERNMSPAKLIQDSLARRIEMVRGLNPQARLYAWSDMLDPYHNACDAYYYCNGPTLGDISTVARDVVILNWNHGGQGGRSPRFFSEEGFRQMLVGSDAGAILKSLHDNPDIAGLIGVYAYPSPDPGEFAATLWGG